MRVCVVHCGQRIADNQTRWEHIKSAQSAEGLQKHGSSGKSPSASQEQLRKKAAEREEYWRKEDEIVNRKFVDKHIAIIERHYPKVDEATREAAIADLMQLWATDIRGGA